MTTPAQDAKNQFIYRGTNKHRGRKIAISPENSSMKHLEYARVILDKDSPTAEFATGDREIGLICLSGECTIDVDGAANELRQYDSMYVPRDSQVKITTTSAVDLAECSAEVDNRYPLRIVRYDEIKQDSALSFDTGGEANQDPPLPCFQRRASSGIVHSGLLRLDTSRDHTLLRDSPEEIGGECHIDDRESSLRLRA